MVQKAITQVQLPNDPAAGLESGTKQYIDAADAAKQPLDSDLTTIAGLTPTTDNFMVAASSAWASRTPAQAKTSLAITEADVSGLVADLAGKVDESALTAKGDLYVATASATPDNLPVGSNGQVLTADSAQATGVKWAAASSSSPTYDYPITGFGLVAATHHPDWNSSIGLSVPAGTFYVARLWLAPNTVVTGAAHWVFAAGSTPGSTNASGYVLFSDAGTQLQKTANDYTLFTSTLWHSKAFPSTYTASPSGEWVRVGIVSSCSGTAVNFGCATNAAAGLYNTTVTGTTRRMSTQTGVTTIPASITPASYGTAATGRPLFGLY